MVRLTGNKEIILPVGYTTSRGDEVVIIDFGGLSFPLDPSVKFISGSTIRRSRVPLASVQFSIDRFKGCYGVRLHMGNPPRFWDLAEPEELAREDFFVATAPEIAEIILSRL